MSPAAEAAEHNREPILWKDRLLRLLRLKERGIVFQARLYDFVYIPEKHSVGVVTEMRSLQLFTVSFFPSLNNTRHFIEEITFNPQTAVVIPSFESLVALGHSLVKRESYSASHPDIVHSGSGVVSEAFKHKLYGRISSKLKTVGDCPDYDFLLDFIAAASQREYRQKE